MKRVRYVLLLAVFLCLDVSAMVFISHASETQKRQSLEQRIAEEKKNLQVHEADASRVESSQRVVAEQPKEKPKPSNPWQKFTATYYDARYQSTGKNPGDAAYGITASGNPVQSGVTIAVDPKVVPLGTWVEIQFPDGHIEKRRADDTGSAIQGHKVDIYIPHATSRSGLHEIQMRKIDPVPN